MSIAIVAIIQIADDLGERLPIDRCDGLKQPLSYTQHYLTIIATGICESHPTTKRVRGKHASVQKKREGNANTSLARAAPVSCGFFAAGRRLSSDIEKFYSKFSISAIYITAIYITAYYINNFTVYN